MWIYKKIRRSISLKLVLVITALSLVSLSIFSGMAYVAAYQVLLSAKENEGKAIATTLAFAIESILSNHDVLEQETYDLLRRMIKNVAKERGVYNVTVLDRGGQQLMQSHPFEPALPVTDRRLITVLEQGRLLVDTEVSSRRMAFFIPLRGGSYYNYKLEKDISALLYFYLDLTDVFNTLKTTTLMRTFIVSVHVLIIALALFALLYRLVLRPTQVLVRQAERLGAGDLSARSGMSCADAEGDEIQRLAYTFDQMAHQIEQGYIKLKQTAEELRASEERLSRIVETIADGITILDRNGRHIFANAAAERILGLPRSTITRRTYNDPAWEVTTPEGNPLSEEDRVFVRVLRTGKPVFGMEQILRRPDGTQILLSRNAAPLCDATGAMVGVVVSLTDVTERRKLEEERLKTQKLESIGVLAGGIAHDFNNILTAILVNISLAKMYTDPEGELFRRLAEAEKASLRARSLTQQLLTFSRGGVPIKKLTSISELIKDSTHFALRGSNVRCEFSISDDLWPVEVDEGQMSQVLHNLILNAQQAMPEGGTIRIRAENKIVDAVEKPGSPLQTGPYVQVSIADEGVGIPEEHLPKIFDPYFTTKQTGSGLGLATTYSILKKHGGYIGVGSKVGVGTTFYIYLPVSQKRISAKAEPARVDSEIHPCARRGRVLVMDDEEGIREATGEMLRYMGYEVGYARDGAEAIDLYKKARELGQPFNVVIMDLTIPGGMGGKDAIKRLMELDPEIKAIVSSGYSSDPVLAMYEQYGFSEAMAKPYKVEDLKQVLEKLIG